MMKSRKGFTLIELLIVVAIIGILAAIAIPNFLQAQTRAKVAKAQSDMRTIALAVELFQTDKGLYPYACSTSASLMKYTPIGIPANTCGFTVSPDTGVSLRYVQLTTPIEYMNSIFKGEDPFAPLNINTGYDSYDYFSANTFRDPLDRYEGFASGYVRGAEFRLASAGPDRVATYGGPNSPYPDNPGYNYDPTNGTISNGDIIRVGPKSSDGGNCMYPDGVVPCW